MLENIINSKPHLATTIKEAIEALNMVAEPMKSKIKKAFDALDNIAVEMNQYKNIDALMDDSASDLTLLSGIDVRVNGVQPALARVIHSNDQARAIIDVVNWHVAKQLKEYIDNE
jgi:hypothetical protein